MQISRPERLSYCYVTIAHLRPPVFSCLHEEFEIFSAVTVTKMTDIDCCDLSLFPPSLSLPISSSPSQIWGNWFDLTATYLILGELLSSKILQDFPHHLLIGRRYRKPNITRESWRNANNYYRLGSQVRSVSYKFVWFRNVLTIPIDWTRQVNRLS